MKAIVHSQYGSPDVLRLENIDNPAPGDGEVLIEVHAAALNPFDRHFLRGMPYVGRPAMGLRRPKTTRVGIDLAGRVVAAGPNVTHCQPGDEVFGGGDGSCAEYVITSQNRVAPKPARLTFEQAAAVPMAATTALQALRDKAGVQPGHSVLVNGASGGVGTFAVQIARAFGATVTGVCSTRNLDLVRFLGAAHVIDYTQSDLTRSGAQYDVIIDCIGNVPLWKIRRVLRRGGVYVAVGGPGGRWLGPLRHLFKVALADRLTSDRLVAFMAQSRRRDLLAIRDLLESAEIAPVIDRVYPLDETAAAMHYLEQGHARGKVVIRIAR
ncbi:MAG TPA: NAD(P)-dependent alcohol dehydrogenase [Thermoanaerobaculia bacterium]|nr:NAD(P)-dependent alcohol dehydrogenase [Thermoanaerobaculia bacterium]